MARVKFYNKETGKWEYADTAYGSGGTVTDEQIASAVEEYLAEHPIEGGNGEPGGYYTPTVTQTDANTMKVSFAASKEGMDTVADQNITLPAGKDGEDGQDGYTPQKGVDYFDGEDGQDGTSPVVSVSAITGGHRITITDANGTKTVDVMDGSDGKDGTNGTNGKDGTSVTVSSVSESTADGGSNVVAFSDGKTLTVKNGKTGAAGKNPVKGVDYWTEADKETIVQEVITALGTPVFGTVDAENNIILTGNLADGTYTLKYEDAEGEQVEIGTVKIGTTYTNMITKAEALDSTALYNGSGYKNGYYASSATPYENTDTNCVLTGLIPYNGSYGATELPSIYIKGATLDTSQSHVRMQVWKEDKTYINGVTLGTNVTIEILADNYYKLTPASDIRNTYGAFGYIRMSLLGTGDNLIITVGEPIE